MSPTISIIAQARKRLSTVAVPVSTPNRTLPTSPYRDKLKSDAPDTAVAVANDPWIDHRSFPHIVENVMRFADLPDLKAWRLVSSACRTYVGTILSRELVLDGEMHNDFPRSSAATVLHNNMWPLIADRRHYCVFESPTEAKLPFGSREAVSENGPCESRVSLPVFNNAEVLDIHGTVRQTVVDGLAELLPNLHTIRYYRMGLGCSGYGSDPKWTSFFSHTDDEVEKQPGPVPSSFAHFAGVRRLVLLTSVIPFHKANTSFPQSYPPNVEEVVISVGYNPALDCSLLFLDGKLPPPSCKRITVILHKIKEIPTERSLESVKDYIFIQSFMDGLLQLGMATTIVGLDELCRFPNLIGIRSYDNCVSWLQGQSTFPVHFKSESDYRMEVGENDWAMFTREKEVVRKFMQCSDFCSGTTVVGTMDGLSIVTDELEGGTHAGLGSAKARVRRWANRLSVSFHRLQRGAET